MTAEASEPGPDSEEDAGIWARTTAPQSPFTTSQVGTGFVVLAVGLLIAFALPLLLG